MSGSPGRQDVGGRNLPDRRPGGTAWDWMRENEIDIREKWTEFPRLYICNNPPDVQPSKTHESQERESQQWIFFVMRNNQYAESKVNQQIAQFTGGWCVLHVDIRWKGVKFYECVLWISLLIFRVFVVTSGCQGMLPWLQGWCVDKIVHLNLEIRA